jgi:hypothetical protein
MSGLTQFADRTSAPCCPHSGSSSSVLDFLRLGDVVSLRDYSRIGSAILIPDFFHFGLTSNLRGFIRCGSSVSVSNATRWFGIIVRVPGPHLCDLERLSASGPRYAFKQADTQRRREETELLTMFRPLHHFSRHTPGRSIQGAFSPWTSNPVRRRLWDHIDRRGGLTSAVDNDIEFLRQAEAVKPAQHATKLTERTTKTYRTYRQTRVGVQGELTLRLDKNPHQQASRRKSFSRTFSEASSEGGVTGRAAGTAGRVVSSWSRPLWGQRRPTESQNSVPRGEISDDFHFCSYKGLADRRSAGG